MVNDRVRKVFYDGHIDDKALDYPLINGKPRVGRFYLLPKIHKKGCPGRPVTLGCGTSTEKVSEFVDFHIKHLIPEIPSYIRDTKHFRRCFMNWEVCRREQFSTQQMSWAYVLTFPMRRAFKVL